MAGPDQALNVNCLQGKHAEITLTAEVYRHFYCQHCLREIRPPERRYCEDDQHAVVLHGHTTHPDFIVYQFRCIKPGCEYRLWLQEARFNLPLNDFIDQYEHQRRNDR